MHLRAKAKVSTLSHHFQAKHLDAIRAVQYLAANLVWHPTERTRAGVEYLFGSRTDKNGARGEANRVMFTIRYDLP